MSAEGLFRSIANRRAGDPRELPDEGRLASFDRATGWIGSGPLTPESLRGRVVLVDFWTYTCVNWLRTFPYLAAWHAKYARSGLTIVGVHTPEFGFEALPENARAQAARLGVDYPIALDSDYGVWDEFANHYWPALYLADDAGRIRYHHFGEGEYAMTEMAIQQLLVAAGARDLDLGLVDVAPEGLQVAADWSTLRSPETYVGYRQSSGFAAEGAALFDRPHRYERRAHLALNTWDLGGDWTVSATAASLNAAGGKIAYAFHARDANLILRADSAIPFRVTLDGGRLGDAHGADTDADGRGVVDRPDTYQLVRQRGSIADRTIEIEFDGSGVEAYCFTFG